MLKLWQSKGPFRFLAPDDGSGSGGASGGSQGDGGEAVVTPFDDIDLDELDETTRNKIVEGKKQFIATLQRTTKLNADLEHTQGLARRFQSEADQAKANFDKVTGKGGGGGPAADPLLDGVRSDLKASGYSDADADKMAPTFVRMFKTFGGSLKSEIGKDLSPMAGTVLMQEATTAFESARDNDPLGSLQIPEVAERTWVLVQERVKANTQTTPAIVANLAKMAFMDYAAEKAGKGETIELRTFSTPAKPSSNGVTTNFSFPGSGTIRPTLPSSRPEGQPVHALNDDTQAALASTFNEMGRGTGVHPKAFPAGSGKKGGQR